MPLWLREQEGDLRVVWVQLAVVGAIAVAGVALVAGAKKVRKEKEDEPKNFAESIQRKVIIRLSSLPGPVCTGTERISIFAG